MSETIIIEGRSNEPTITISGSWDDGDGSYGSVEYRLEGAEIRNEGSKFRIEVRHENGTDFEHDSSKVALFEGVGLALSGAYGPSISFEGAVLKAWYYPKGTTFEPGAQFPHDEDTEVVTVCDDDYYHPEGAGWPKGHLLMPYMPPQVKNFPTLTNARIHVSYSRFLPKEES
jgi:hypothetical protein